MTDPLQDFDPAQCPPRPLPNTYWVKPGRMLAGEYPGAWEHGEALERLRRLRAAGIDTFVDLTEPGELPSYEELLAEAGGGFRYRRFAITDHGLPRNAAAVCDILDYIDAALRDDRWLYVHCRAGLGRTGTVIGCHLIRCGLSGEMALKRLAILWLQSERSRLLPYVPETEEQTAFVRAWRDRSIVADARDAGGQVAGALYGLALGEASLAQSPGQWGANAAMTLLLAGSLLERGGHDPDDQMRRYLRWQQARSLPGAGFDIDVPADVRRALAAWQWTRKPYAGSHDPANLDPHSVPRTTAIALFFRAQPAAVVEAAAEASRTTQQSPVVLDACRLFALLLLAVLEGTPKEQVPAAAGERAALLLRGRAFKPEVQAILAERGSAGRQPHPGTAPGALGAAVRAFLQADDFVTGLTLLAQRAPGATSAAALYGALAGAHYTTAGLPVELRTRLSAYETFDDLAGRLAVARPAAAS